MFRLQVSWCIIWLTFVIIWVQSLHGSQERSSFTSQIHIAHKRLCETKNQDVRLVPKDNYEFLPKIYTEIRCKNAILDNVSVFVDKTNGQCSKIGMECVQQYRIMHAMRRRMDDPNRCWEPVPIDIVVPYGCDCMHPYKEFKFNKISSRSVGEIEDIFTEK